MHDTESSSPVFIHFEIRLTAEHKRGWEINRQKAGKIQKIAWTNSLYACKTVSYTAGGHVPALAVHLTVKLYKRTMHGTRAQQHKNLQQTAGWDCSGELLVCGAAKLTQHCYGTTTGRHKRKYIHTNTSEKWPVMQGEMRNLHSNSWQDGVCSNTDDTLTTEEHSDIHWQAVLNMGYTECSHYNTENALVKLAVLDHVSACAASCSKTPVPTVIISCSGYPDRQFGLTNSLNKAGDWNIPCRKQENPAPCLIYREQTSEICCHPHTHKKQTPVWFI